MPRQVHDPERTRRAALAYLHGGDLSSLEVARQYGISRSILWAEIRRMRDFGQRLNESTTPPTTNAGTAG